MPIVNKNITYTEDAREMVIQAFKKSGYSISELAKRTNINYSNLNHYLRYRNDLRTGDFLALCLVLKIDLSRFDYSKY